MQNMDKTPYMYIKYVCNDNIVENMKTTIHISIKNSYFTYSCFT